MSHSEGLYSSFCCFACYLNMSEAFSGLPIGGLLGQNILSKF